MFKIFPLNAYRFLFEEHDSEMLIEPDLALVLQRIRRGEAVLDEFFLASDFFDYYSQHQHSTAILEMALANWKNESVCFRLALNYLRAQKDESALKILAYINEPDMLDHILMIIANLRLNRRMVAKDLFRPYAHNPDFAAELNSFDQSVLPDDLKNRIFNELELFLD